MFGSAVLEVALGLALVYFVLATITSRLNETLASLFQWRGKFLEQAIRDLVGDPDVARQVMEDPVIAGMRAQPGRRPSYVPAEMFSVTLLSVLEDRAGKGGPNLKRLPIEDLIATLGRSEADTGKALEAWYDQAMNRVTGAYKRHCQRMVLAIGLVLTVAVGADTIPIATTLWQEETVRAVASAAAQKVAGTDGAGANLSSLTQGGLPLGWPHLPGSIQDWAIKTTGLLITTIAVWLGAPFWFDALQSLTNTRLAGPKPTPAGSGSTRRRRSPGGPTVSALTDSS